MLINRSVRVVAGVFLSIFIAVKGNPQVTVNQGILEGRTLITENGFAYNAFSGVPYARPPVGNLKFQDPHPPENWEGIRNASTEGSMCPGYGLFLSNDYDGHEDCLFLNVYAPENATPDSELPVMFWIHGGSFTAGNGNSDIYGPDHLIEKNLIIVTINYRLGPLGFLSLHTREVPGNAGLKDQVLALQWVNNNIQFFGGNKQNVTIFGESAGGASIHLLTLSPLATGLFAQAISQSGVGVNEWAIQSDPVSKAFQLGELLGLQTRDKEELLRYLINVPTKTLITASLNIFSENNELPMSPVIEQSFPQVAAFLTENPRELMLSGRYNKVPSIYGFNSNEGLPFAFDLIDGQDLSMVTVDDIIKNFNIYVPKHLAQHLDMDATTIVANTIKEFYFNNSNTLLNNLITLASDYAFVKDINFSVKLLAQYNPATYYYRFSYSGNLNFMYAFYQIFYEGATHGDELGYLFKTSFPMQPSVTDSKVLNEMTELWTNFAKYGNPTPELSENINIIWNPVTRDQLNCLDINEETVLIQKPFEDRTRFWESLDDLYGNANI